MTINEKIKALSDPFPPEKISWRIGALNKDRTKGIALAYIDARDVMDRFDSVLSPLGWQNRYTHADTKTICEIGVYTGSEWIWKANGAGDTKVEAQKGATSDAFKRAAVLFGVGRYLYDIPTVWVAYDDKTRSIKKFEYDRLQSILPGSQVEQGEPIDDKEDISSRLQYIADCKYFIREVSSKGELVKWWDNNKQARRDFDLTQEDINELKKCIAERGLS